MSMCRPSIGLHLQQFQLQLSQDVSRRWKVIQLQGNKKGQRIRRWPQSAAGWGRPTHHSPAKLSAYLHRHSAPQDFSCCCRGCQAAGWVYHPFFWTLPATEWQPPSPHTPQRCHACCNCAVCCVCWTSGLPRLHCLPFPSVSSVLIIIPLTGSPVLPPRCPPQLHA
jgi:hypothetical protein